MYGLCRVIARPGYLWLLSTVLIAGCCSYAGLPIIEVEVNERPLLLEVAADRPSRSCGLAYRRSLPEGHGMLFVVPEPEPLEFWMRDTRIPLAIAFLDQQGRILSIEQALMSGRDARYRSPGPAAFAIEVAAGWFEKNDVSVGDLLQINLPPELEVR